MVQDLIDEDAVSALLVDAIADQRLSAVAERLIEERHLDDAGLALARAGLAACRAISQEMAAVQSRAVEVLSANGVSAKPLDNLAKGATLQFHSARLQISRRDLGRALLALGEIGFEPPVEMTQGRIAALCRTAESLQLVRFDAATTRLILVFDTDPPSIVPRSFRPRTADLAMVSLPKFAARGYALAKPLRMMREALTGRRSPYHEIDFLGTPEGLIAPILEVLKLGPQDVLLDLGCGDGRILSVAAENFGCRAIGIEHNTELVLRARARAETSDYRHLIELREGSAAQADLSEATVVFVFLPSQVLRELLPGVRARMRKGARLVIHEQSRPGAEFAFDKAIPVFGPDGVTVVRVQNL